MVYRRNRRWKRNHTRNFDDPKYVDWRKKVFARDRHSCQWPECGSSKRLNAHHIKKWADDYHARFNVNNGITLCKRCHDRVHGKEEEYALFFHKIIIRNMMRDDKE